MMDAVEYLDNYKKLDAVISNKLEQHRRWVQVAEGLGGASDGDRVQTSRKLDTIPNAIVNYIYIGQEINELRRQQADIMQTLERLPFTEYETLYMLFIRDCTLKEVAWYFKRSYETAKRYKKSGLERLQRMIDERGA